MSLVSQLDRYRQPANGDATSPRAEATHESERNSAPETTIDDADSQSTHSRNTGRESTSSFRSRQGWKDGERGIPSWIECECSNPSLVDNPDIDCRAATNSFANRKADRSATPTRTERGSRALIAADEPSEEPVNERQVAQRSRWQAMLLEAGGLSAALSEESMRRLKYCLQWLQVRPIPHLSHPSYSFYLVCNRPHRRPNSHPPRIHR